MSTIGQASSANTQEIYHADAPGYLQEFIGPPVEEKNPIDDMVSQTLKEEMEQTASQTKFNKNIYEAYLDEYNYQSGNVTRENVTDAVALRLHELHELSKMAENAGGEHYDVYADMELKNYLFEQESTRINNAASSAASLYALNSLEARGETLLQNSAERIKEAASQKAEQEIAEKQIENLLKNNREYLVRGAMLQCHLGTHFRRLDMEKSHGVYVNGHPVAVMSDSTPENLDIYHPLDAKNDKNIRCFGHCLAENPPKDEPKVRLRTFVNTDSAGNFVAPSEDDTTPGYKCIPSFKNQSNNGYWMNAYEKMQITPNKTNEIGRYLSNDNAKGWCHAAITLRSYLQCDHGGIIFPISSGQIDYLPYISAWAEQGFDFNDPDLVANFCKDNNICGEKNGTPEHTDWYRTEIEKAMHDLKEAQKKLAEEDRKRSDFDKQYGEGAYYDSTERDAAQLALAEAQKRLDYLQRRYLLDMRTLGFEYLSDDQKAVLILLAKQQGISLNDLLNNYTTQHGSTVDLFDSEKNNYRAGTDANLQWSLDFMNKHVAQYKDLDKAYWDAAATYGEDVDFYNTMKDSVKKEMKDAYNDFLRDVSWFGYDNLSPAQQAQAQQIVESYYSVNPSKDGKIPSLAEEAANYK